ncbi:MAG TPA: cyclic nucleotide-binding domain-containing protein [Kofleriaceae bacterium]|nr:cyclic nucleotide-binding domain-containing protein [Kofleriaceae bacterium]
MFDHDLDAVVLRRVMALRHFALLDDVELAELATLAQNVSETTLVPGARVPATPEAVHFVLAGSIEAPGARPSVAGEVFGALELWANRPLPADARAVGPTRTLCLAAEDMFEVLDDNIGLLRACVRAIAAIGVTRAPRDPGERSLVIASPLGLVERLQLLRRQAPLARARIRALTRLAHVSHELTWPAGTIVVRGGEPATSSYVVVDGSVRSSARGDAVFAGGEFGLLETLAGRAHVDTFEAAAPLRVLASSQAALLDVLDDHSDLGFAVLAALAGDLLDQRPAWARPNTRVLTSSTTTR